MSSDTTAADIGFFAEAQRGAVDFEECPSTARPRHCKCGRCAKCGYPKHTSVHGPVLGAEPGSKPWDHEFVGIKGE